MMFRVNHMKNRALFSLKDKNKKLKCCLQQFLFSALRVNDNDILEHINSRDHCIP